MNLATWLLDVRRNDDSRDPTTLFALIKSDPPKGFSASLKTNRRTISLTLRKKAAYESDLHLSS
jgi:hypothetical protein